MLQCDFPVLLDSEQPSSPKQGYCTKFLFSWSIQTYCQWWMVEKQQQWYLDPCRHKRSPILPEECPDSRVPWMVKPKAYTTRCVIINWNVGMYLYRKDQGQSPSVQSGSVMSVGVRQMHLMQYPSSKTFQPFQVILKCCVVNK